MDLWDEIRGRWVAATPEEEIRQKWISIMIGPLGYPKGLLSVEKELASLPSTSFDPRRRLDLLCYTPGKGGLIPLLLVEFKAAKVDAAAQKQALGYNDSVGAPFVCLVNGGGAKTLWREQGKISCLPFLPSYAQLVEKL